MDTKNIRRTFHLTPKANRALNCYVTAYCATETGTTYGGASSTISDAILHYTSRDASRGYSVTNCTAINCIEEIKIE